MQKWKQAYNKWFMANYEPQILNSLDKHSEMTNYQLNQRLQDTHKDIEQQMFMQQFFNEMYEKQEEEKGVLKIDTKQAKQEISGAVEDLESFIEKIF